MNYLYVIICYYLLFYKSILSIINFLLLSLHFVF